MVARSPSVFTQAYGAGIDVVATGYFDQNLSNGGETIALLGPLGELLQEFTYDDSGDWPTAPDGNGKSLEIIDPLGDLSDPANWRESFYIGGSPGTEGLPPVIAGDFDGDGDVDGRDFLAWQRGFGRPALQASAEHGDADGDRDVDGADLGLWQGNYGQPAQLAAIVTAEVDSANSILPPQSEFWGVLPVPATLPREETIDAAFAEQIEQFSASDEFDDWYDIERTLPERESTLALALSGEESVTDETVDGLSEQLVAERMQSF